MNLSRTIVVSAAFVCMAILQDESALLKAEGAIRVDSVFTPGNAANSAVFDVALYGYDGPTMTALQFTIVCERPWHAHTLDCGSDFLDPSKWQVHSEIRAGKTGGDTVRVVILSLTTGGIGRKQRVHLLRVSAVPEANTPSESSLSTKVLEVVGALPNGERAPVRAFR
jgi:hypothetical protein